jgi:hypothetical protein
MVGNAGVLFLSEMLDYEIYQICQQCQPADDNSLKPAAFHPFSHSQSIILRINTVQSWRGWCNSYTPKFPKAE